jgi:hypothetical protein
MGQGTLFTNLGKDSPAKTKKDPKRVTIKIERYSNPEEYFNDQDFSSESSDSDLSDGDDEWRKTPLVKRIRQERRSMAPHLAKRKRDSLDSEEEGNEEDSSLNGTRNKKSLQGCTCKKGCKTKACSCKKKGSHCVVLCKCDPHKCANRENPGTDVSSSVETDKENDPMDDTDQLLDSTYNLGTTNAASIMGKKSPVKPIFRDPVSSASDIFAMDSDNELTPKVAPLRERIFDIPNIDD